MYDIEKHEKEMEEAMERFCEHLQREEDEALIIDNGEFKIVCVADPENGPEFDGWIVVGVKSGREYMYLDLETITDYDELIEELIQRTLELKKH